MSYLFHHPHQLREIRIGHPMASATVRANHVWTPTPLATIAVGPASPERPTRITHDRRSARPPPRRRRHSLTGSVLPSTAVAQALRLMLPKEPLVLGGNGKALEPMRGAAAGTTKVRRKPVPVLTSGDWEVLRTKTDGLAGRKDVASHRISAFEDANLSGELMEADPLTGTAPTSFRGSQPTTTRSEEFASMTTFPPFSYCTPSTYPPEDEEVLGSTRPPRRTHTKDYSLTLPIPSGELDIEFGTPDTILQTSHITDEMHSRSWRNKAWSEWGQASDDERESEGVRSGLSSLGLGMGSVEQLGLKRERERRPSGDTSAFELDDLSVRRSPVVGPHYAWRDEPLGPAGIEIISASSASWRDSARSGESDTEETNGISGYWTALSILGSPRASFAASRGDNAVFRDQQTSAPKKVNQGAPSLSKWVERLSRAISPIPPVQADPPGAFYVKRSDVWGQSGAERLSTHEALHRAMFAEEGRAAASAEEGERADYDKQSVDPTKRDALMDTNHRIKTDTHNIAPSNQGTSTTQPLTPGWSSSKTPPSHHRDRLRRISMSSGISSLGLSDVEEVSPDPRLENQSRDLRLPCPPQVIAFGSPSATASQQPSYSATKMYYLFPPPPVSGGPTLFRQDNEAQRDALTIRTGTTPSSFSERASAAAAPSSPSDYSNIKITKHNRRNTFGQMASWVTGRSVTTYATPRKKDPSRWPSSYLSTRSSTNEMPPIPSLRAPERTYEPSYSPPSSLSTMRPLPQTPPKSQHSLASSYGLHGLGLFSQPSFDGMSYRSGPSEGGALYTHADPEGRSLVGAPSYRYNPGAARAGSHRASQPGARDWSCGCCS